MAPKFTLLLLLALTVTSIPSTQCILSIFHNHSLPNILESSYCTIGGHPSTSFARQVVLIQSTDILEGCTLSPSIPVYNRIAIFPSPKFSDKVQKRCASSIYGVNIGLARMVQNLGGAAIIFTAPEQVYS